jgi:hypothetical protein
VDKNRIWLERCLSIQHVWQYFVVNLDQFQRVPCGFRTFCNNSGNLITDMTKLGVEQKAQPAVPRDLRSI